MEMESDIRERPDVSAEERASQELIKRILKLRWIGMDVEAAQMLLARRCIEPACKLLAGPYETD
jgi:hypothetical protein